MYLFRNFAESFQIYQHQKIQKHENEITSAAHGNGIPRRRVVFHGMREG